MTVPQHTPLHTADFARRQLVVVECQGQAHIVRCCAKVTPWACAHRAPDAAPAATAPAPPPAKTDRDTVPDKMGDDQYRATIDQWVTKP